MAGLRKVALVTDVDFWRIGTGGRNRARSLIEFLDKNTQLSIIFSWSYRKVDEILFKRLRLRGNLNWLPDAHLGEKAQQDFVVQFLSDEGIDVFIVNTLRLAYLAKNIPMNVRKFVDVDDLHSECYTSEAEIGIYNKTKPVTFAQELSVYANFDKILLIQYEHFSLFQRYFPSEKLLYVSYPVIPKRKTTSPVVKSIGYVASGWHASVTGILWFLDNVWPHFQDRGIYLDIYGYICSSIQHVTAKNMRLMGSPLDIGDAYKSIDIAINPVRSGSGLKIKTVEALAHGVPIVVSSEGARGLNHLDKVALLKASDTASYVGALDLLIESVELRRNLALNGTRYINEHHNIDICYQQLLVAVNSPENQQVPITA